MRGPLAGKLLSFSAGGEHHAEDQDSLQRAGIFQPVRIAARNPHGLRTSPARERGEEKKFVFNVEQFARKEDMPVDVRKLCDDVMGVIENTAR